MGTWIKETDRALYLMDGDYYIDMVSKSPSPTNPQEQIAETDTLKVWFSRDDKPQWMAIAIGTGAPEPEPLPEQPTPPLPLLPETPDSDGGIPPAQHGGMQIRVISDTLFKLKPKLSGELADREKIFVESGTVFDIQYYTEASNNHWLLELFEPTLGDQQTTSWYAYFPDIELLSDTTLFVTGDTLFKRQPKLSIDLPAKAKEFVKNGTQFKLVSYEPAANNHTKIELANATLGADRETTWYAFSPDVTIKGQRQVLQVVSDTLFKTRPAQSSELTESEKVFVRNKTFFLTNSYAQPKDFHIKVALQGAFLGPQGRNTWYCFVPDIRILGTEIGNHPNDRNPSSNPSTPPRDRGIPLQFPGFSGTYYSNNPIYPQNQYGERGNFTWGEAVHADPSTGRYRRPASAGVVYGILDIAKVLEEIRRRYQNKPLQINSWYRDPATNAAVGGASQSRHMTGDAVDFVVPGIHPYDVYDDLNAWWGNRGGLASSTVFTHIDIRGYRARWDYGY